MVLKRSCGSKDGASHNGWARPCHNTGRATLSEGVLAREKGREKARRAHLSSGVPNLQLYALAVQRDGADFEIDADCGYVGFRVCIVRKAQQQA